MFERDDDMTDRPFWLLGPCPPWCVSSHQHRDKLEDRRHRSEALGRVQLSVTPTGGVNAPVAIEVILEQGYREVEPVVQMRRFARDGYAFTLEEADELVGALTAAVEIARYSSREVAAE